MTQRSATVYTTPFIMLILAFALLMPSSAAAQSDTDINAGQGVLGEGPTTTQTFFIPLVQTSTALGSNCPVQVENGVLCDGPVIPDGPAGSADQTADSPAASDQAFFAPPFSSEPG